MTSIKAALFDADDVVIAHGSLFSEVICAKENEQSVHAFDNFFRYEFPKALDGRVDLKKLLQHNWDIWRYDGDVDSLIDEWLSTEDHIDEEVLNDIKTIRSYGVSIHLVSNQEKYRANYIRQNMFPGVFDDYFFSSEIGSLKKSDDFWSIVLATLSRKIPNLRSNEVVFYDDDPETSLPPGVPEYSAQVYKDVNQIESLIKHLDLASHK